MTESETYQVEDIFYGALEITDATSRAEFLNHACAGEPDLRATVEQLLSSHLEAEQFFSESSQAVAPAIEALQAFAGEQRFTESGETGASSEDAQGQQIGPYHVLQKIGEGGCGVVYLAAQDSPVRRQVALKIIKLGMDTRSVIARFKAEQQVLALMEHPNIAHVLDAGATATGRPYFVMELVRGLKLTDYCDEHRLDVQARLELFIQVCHAVQHAHQKGIIHRDLKPSNILVTLHDGVPVPKVIDFGIAKATEGRLSDNTLFTAVDQFIGTPTYMSPEQAETGGMDVDTRSDIYSLGVLLYELLTGRTPFEQQQLVGAGLTAMRRTLRETVPCPPSTVLMTRRRQEPPAMTQPQPVEPRNPVLLVRGDLDWIVMKALEKDRWRRYGTVDALAQDVRRFLNQEAVLARPPSRVYRLGKLVRRNKVVFAAGAAVFVALAVGFGVSTWLFIREREAHMEQVRLRKEAENRQRLTQATVLLARDQFGEADELLQEIPATEASLEYATLYRTLGGWHAIHGRWQKAGERFAVLSQMNDSAEVTMDYLRQAPVLISAGDMAGYDHFRRSAIARYTNTTDPVLAERVVKVSLLTPTDRRMVRELQPLAEIAAQSLAESGPDVNVGLAAWRAFSLALMKFREDDYAGAVALCDRSLEYYFSNDALSANRGAVLAMVHFRLGQTDAARAELDRCRDAIAAQRRASPNFYWYWFDWAFAAVLLDEAAAMIGN
ncbi:MAG: serine/threonine-protein kinase [Verrucomicrobiota bacterium]